MKLSIRKTALHLAAAVLLAFALGAAADPYPLDDVIDACEGAYDNGQQIDQCIMNVCDFYGCSGW